MPFNYNTTNEPYFHYPKNITPDIPNTENLPLIERCYNSIRDAIINRHAPQHSFHYDIQACKTDTNIQRIMNNAQAAKKSYNTKMWLCACQIGATLDEYLNSYYEEHPSGHVNLDEAAMALKIPPTQALVGDRVYKLFNGCIEAVREIKGLKIEQMADLTTSEFDTIYWKIWHLKQKYLGNWWEDNEESEQSWEKEDDGGDYDVGVYGDD